MYAPRLILRRGLLCALLLCLSTATTTRAEGPKHVLFAFIDHYEPIRNDWLDVNAWAQPYMDMASQHTDADGRHPSHGFFQLVGTAGFSQVNRDRHGILDSLNQVVYRGFGEIDCHLHLGVPDERTRTEAEAVAEWNELMYSAKVDFQRRGAWITAECEPQTAFAFNHGYWALDNSLWDYWTVPDDPHYSYNGVNDEITRLADMGCYADFTMPSWGPMNVTEHNTIFHIQDDPQPTSYNNPDNRREVAVGEEPFGDLMLLPGPGELASYAYIGLVGSESKPPTLERMDEWVADNVHVAGQEEWVFVRTMTHGAVGLYRDDVWDHYFGETMHQFYRDLETHYNDGENYVLHYVSPREMYNIAVAAAEGNTGDPNEYRDYAIAPYANTRILTENHYTPSTIDIDTVLEILDDGQAVDICLKDYAPGDIILEADSPSGPWLPSDATTSAGEFGEMHMQDSTASDWYRFVPSLSPGDCDADGDVDSQDLALLGRHWDAISDDKLWRNGDFDFDGDVDAVDLAQIGLHWNPATVPEPMSLGWLMLSAVVFRRNKH